MERIARDLSNLAEALSPNRRAALVGHDWGAAATYFAIARSPERFCRAITMAVPHPAAFASNAPRLDGQLGRSSYMLLFQLPFLADRAVEKDDFALIDRLYSAWSPGFELDRTARSELKRCLAKSLPAPLGYYRALLRSAPSYRRALLELSRTKITVPTLYLHGARDGCIGYGAARNQERFFKAEFRSELLSGVGHFLHLEDPDRVEARLAEWLAPIA
jgi:pimeloyl-ACP methyl ester carboxylesterase